jgi:hypothetical protein
MGIHVGETGGDRSSRSDYRFATASALRLSNLC